MRIRNAPLRSSRAILGFCAAWVVQAGEVPDRPVLWKEIQVPAPFRQTAEVDGERLTFGGDLRVGDLDGDGALNLVVFRSVDAALKPCFMGAFDLTGEPRWSIGSAGDQPARPGPVTLFDFDGDGADEVLHLWHDPTVVAPVENMADVVLQLRSGRDGRLLRESRPEIFRQSSGAGANWVHQRLLIANLSGGDRASEFVVKLGSRLVAFDAALEMLWHYDIPWNEYTRCSAYIPAIGDIDGDGKDEITGGYYLLDDDGTVMWQAQLGRNMDSVAIVPWDDGKVRVVASGGGYVLDAQGNAVLHLGEALVPHGQEVRVGDFRPELPGPEKIIRWNGHRADAMVVANDGTVLTRFRLNDSPNHTGIETIHWHGQGEPSLLYNGGMLWNGHGRRFAEFPDLPPPVGDRKMGWYHCIPLDVVGDDAEEVLLYNPWESVVRIYRSAASSTEVRPFVPTARQYNVRLMD